jgi:membrane protein implicated in regulation of membrane protease activity
MKTTSPQRVKLFPKNVYGTVEKRITPTQPGRVRFQGSTWKARFYAAACPMLVPGDAVKVVGLEGITLLVLPKGDASDTLDR